MTELDVPEGVQAFNLWTLWIMARMWEEFPKVQFFHADRLAVYVSSDHTVAGTKIGPEGPEQANLFVNTLAWLLAEDFVDGLRRGTAFMNIRLTSKGFSVLNQVPNSISPRPENERKSLGNLMREATAKHVVDSAAVLIERMLKS